MGQSVMILGSSGSGKSASLRNFNKSEVLILNVANKLLPFKNDLNVVKLKRMAYSERYDAIKEYLKKYQSKCKVFVVDDSQFLMALEYLQRSNEKGYDKYTEIGSKWMDLMNFVDDLDDDVVVYFLHHNDYDSTSGVYKAKTVGRMVDQYMSPESLCTIVLGAKAYDGKYIFTTKTDGFDTIKTPIGMFEDDEIDNDLKQVDSVIREYYGLNQEDKSKAQ